MSVSSYTFNSVSFSLLGTRAGHLQSVSGDPEGDEDPGPTTQHQERKVTCNQKLPWEVGEKRQVGWELNFEWPS